MVDFVSISFMWLYNRIFVKTHHSRSLAKIGPRLFRFIMEMSDLFIAYLKTTICRHSKKRIKLKKVIVWKKLLVTFFNSLKMFAHFVNLAGFCKCLFHEDLTTHFWRNFFHVVMRYQKFGKLRKSVSHQAH